MWYWCGAPFSGLWWMFPLMFIFCMVVMCFVLRAFVGGKFPCGCMHGMMGRTRDDARYGARGESRKGSPGKEGH